MIKNKCTPDSYFDAAYLLATVHPDGVPKHLLELLHSYKLTLDESQKAFQKLIDAIEIDIGEKCS